MHYLKTHNRHASAHAFKLHALIAVILNKYIESKYILKLKVCIRNYIENFQFYPLLI